MALSPLMIEYVVGVITAAAWPIAASVSLVPKTLAPPRGRVSRVAPDDAASLTLAAGIAAVVALVVAVVVFYDGAMRKHYYPPAVLLGLNAAGLALATLPLATIAARGRVLGARVWFGLALTLGVMAAVWALLFDALARRPAHGSPALFWSALAWSALAVVLNVIVGAVERRAGTERAAGTALGHAAAWSAPATAGVALALLIGVATRWVSGSVATVAYVHHAGLVAAAVVTALPVLARDPADRRALTGLILAWGTLVTVAGLAAAQLMPWL